MSFHKTKVSVIGLGYIGLPTAAVLASIGHEVVGVDVRPHIIDIINRGGVHIVEPDLDGLVRGSVLSGRLRAVLAVESSDVFIIAVPTPFKKDHQPNLEYVEQAAHSIAPVLRRGNLVILESTSPVGTTEKLAKWMAADRDDLNFPDGQNLAPDVNLAYCPERVLPGCIVSELVKNDRVVGGLTPDCAAKARRLYESFVVGQCIETDARTAEMTKLTENAFRDVNIAFANELSMICDELGIDVWSLIPLANRHPRVKILNPGPGVGGHCIAVDPWFIVDSAPSTARLIRTARQVNVRKPEWVLEKVANAARHSEQRLGRDAIIACLGLSFKGNIDDLRESPSLEIAERLASRLPAQRLLVVEPYVEKLPECLAPYQCVELVELETALNTADIIVLLVDHRQFKSVDRSALAGKTIIDTRGALR